MASVKGNSIEVFGTYCVFCFCRETARWSNAKCIVLAVVLLHAY